MDYVRLSEDIEISLIEDESDDFFEEIEIVSTEIKEIEIKETEINSVENLFAYYDEEEEEEEE